MQPAKNIPTEQQSLYKGAKLLVVDDNPDLLRLIDLRLKPYEFDLRLAHSAEEALSILEHFSCDLLLTDLKMPGMSGIELFHTVHSKNPLMPVIILTAHGTISEAVEATQAGVAGYISKPFESGELINRIIETLENTGFSRNREREEDSPEWFGPLLFRSNAMKALMSEAKTQAKTNNLLLIEGEPGTGKDQFARALHRLSLRRDAPLKQFSCAALPEHILMDEVFGFIGTGTDSAPEKEGLIRKANKGTLIVSDYDEGSNELLASILTASVEGYYAHRNGARSHRVDLRIIGTTNAPVDMTGHPAKIISDAQTINATILRLPRLVDRLEDIPLITNHYLANVLKRPELTFSKKAMQVLMQAEWPGNVRHLLNVIQQCARLTTTKIISDSIVKSRINSPLYEIPPLSAAQRTFERKYLTRVLKATNGNVTKAAEIAKRNRTEFHRLLKKHRIEAQTFRQ